VTGHVGFEALEGLYGKHLRFSVTGGVTARCTNLAYRWSLFYGFSRI